MSFIKTGIFQSGFLSNCHVNINRILVEGPKILQVRNYAARKGTRERKKKNKVKVEVQKVGFIPHNQRDKEKFLLNREQRKFDDSWKKDATDNVYPMKYYKWIVYSFEDAVKAHRETHHPDIYGQPTANLHASVELNMQSEKKNRFLDNFTRIAAMPNKFEHGEQRSILVFSKNEEDQKAASAAGAELAGGVELIKQVQSGSILLTDFQHIVAHPNILPELVVLRGLMKRRFPSLNLGTLVVDVVSVVEKYLNGTSYSAVKDEYEKDFASADAIIGTINMDPKHLEENFASFVNDVYTMKPKTNAAFIRRCLLWSPPSPEKLKVDHNIYIQEQTEEKEEPEEEPEKIAL